jgi:hypothetical protein
MRMSASCRQLPRLGSPPCRIENDVERPTRFAGIRQRPLAFAACHTLFQLSIVVDDEARVGPARLAALAGTPACLGQERRPVGHQRNSLLQQVAAPIGRFDLVSDRVRQRHLGDFAGCCVHSETQSRKVLRKP